MYVPMHTIYLNSDLVSREVVVGLRPTLPMEGVSLILGNDLAGERVIPDLQVVTEQEVMKKVDGDVEATSLFSSLRRDYGHGQRNE